VVRRGDMEQQQRPAIIILDAADMHFAFRGATHVVVEDGVLCLEKRETTETETPEVFLWGLYRGVRKRVSVHRTDVARFAKGQWKAFWVAGCKIPAITETKAE
jgi:hypothetical protein